MLARLDAEDSASGVVQAVRRSITRPERRASFAPWLLAAAALMLQHRPDLRFVMPVVPGLQALVAPLAAMHPQLPITLLDLRDAQRPLAQLRPLLRRRRLLLRGRLRWLLLPRRLLLLHLL